MSDSLDFNEFVKKCADSGEQKYKLDRFWQVLCASVIADPQLNNDGHIQFACKLVNAALKCEDNVCS